MGIKLMIPALEAKKDEDSPKLTHAKKLLAEVSKFKVSNNCQKFAAALELKFRGVDKKVTPTTTPFARVFDIPKGKAYPIQNWCLFKNAKFTKIGDDAVASITKTMKSWGNGSRAIIACRWKSGRGHVFNLINIDDEIYLMDATANRMKPISSSSYIKENIDSKNSFGLIRTDSGSPDKDLVAATFDEEGDIRFALKKGDTGIRSPSTSSILAYLRYWKPKAGETFTVLQGSKTTKLEEVGKIKTTVEDARYGDDAVWGYEWV